MFSIVAIVLSLMLGACGVDLPSGQRQRDTEPQRSLPKAESPDSSNRETLNERLTDLKITQKLYRALRQDHATSQHKFRIKVATRRGVTTLAGSVSSEREKTLVEAIAAKIVGADRLRSKIAVSQQAGAND